MTVSELIDQLSKLDKGKEINFVAGMEQGMTYVSAHSGELDLGFKSDDEDDKKIVFFLSFEEENISDF